MMKSIYNFFLCIIVAILGQLDALAQTTVQHVYSEQINDSLTRFYFDQNYFLVDKNCEFKAIERVAKFNKEIHKFDGEFKDFGASGHVILSGNYNKGIKEGVFKAYYPDGTLRWESYFENNNPKGAWKYYYPSGRPNLFISLHDESLWINQLWDRTGKQLVVDGKGVYDLELPILGYTEHGYLSYRWRGKVENATPVGRWDVMFLNKGRPTEQIGSFSFKDGKVAGYSSNIPLFENYYGSMESLNEFNLTYSDVFPTAERLITKDCSFDDHTGFTTFLERKFRRFLARSYTRSTESIHTAMTYTIEVSQKGIPTVGTINIEQDLDKSQQIILRNMVNEIYYYLPSYLNNEPIKDILTISLEISIDAQKEIFNVSHLKIKREKGI